MSTDYYRRRPVEVTDTPEVPASTQQVTFFERIWKKLEEIEAKVDKLTTEVQQKGPIDNERRGNH